MLHRHGRGEPERGRRRPDRVDDDPGAQDEERTAQVVDLPIGGTLHDEEVGREADRDAALVLITDGEDHESFPLEAAALARERGVRIFTVGIGDPAALEPQLAKTPRPPTGRAPEST